MPLLNMLLLKSDLKILLCLMAEDFTLSNARRCYLSKGDPLMVKGLTYNIIITCTLSIIIGNYYL